MKRNSLQTKVYPTTVIPLATINPVATTGSYIGEDKARTDHLRNNNYMNGVSLPKIPDLQEEENLEIDLTEEEFNYAVRMTEHSIRKLTKSHILELKSLMKPHPLVEKVMKIICLLRGCQACNLRTAQELMN